MASRKLTRKLSSMLIIVGGGSALFTAHAVYTGSSKFYSNILMPSLQTFISAETAHNLAIKAIRSGFYPRTSYDCDRLHTEVMGRQLSNPIGIAAGFDKHIEAVDGLFNLGFGFVEVGGVTPEPQSGNSKPRVFRLSEDRAIINRCGFNSCGHTKAAARLEAVYNTQEGETPKRLIGVNLGKNKDSVDAASDYVKGVNVFGKMADFLVVNVSSPNTKGLRDLQGKDQLTNIMNKVVKARDALECQNKPDILIKIAPDLTERDKLDIAAIVTTKDSGITGLVVSNTTVTRPENLQSSNKVEVGGLSGAPLRDMSTQLIRDMYTLTAGKILIIGVGGVFSGQDAYDKLAAGASLVQIYSALAYEGPPVVNKIKQELNEILESKGMKSVRQAVGADVLNIKQAKQASC